MKRGHVTGSKPEPKGASDWYREIEEENIRRIEAEWAAKEQGVTTMFEAKIEREVITFSAKKDTLAEILAVVEDETTRYGDVKRVSAWEDGELIEVPEIEELLAAQGA